MEEFDINKYFLDQAKILDPFGSIGLYKVVEFIINYPYNNLLLLNVVSFNIKKSLDEKIESSIKDLYRLYAGALLELDDKSFNSFLEKTPKEYFLYFNDDLYRFTGKILEEKIKTLIDNK